MTDKQKLIKLLNYFGDASTFEDIVCGYMEYYSKDFTASRICNFVQTLNRDSLLDKVAKLERNSRIAHERATYLKCYLEGNMYADEDVARQCVDLQIENAKAILESAKEVTL